MTGHYTPDAGCPDCGGQVRRWRGKAVHRWLEIWHCISCNSFIECMCDTCQVMKALAG